MAALTRRQVSTGGSTKDVQFARSAHLGAEPTAGSAAGVTEPAGKQPPDRDDRIRRPAAARPAAVRACVIVAIRAPAAWGWCDRDPREGVDSPCRYM